MSEHMEVDSVHEDVISSTVTATKDSKSKKQTPKPKIGRMYVKGVFVGYRRGRHKQRLSQSLLRLDGVLNKDEARWYLGKRCAYVYRAKTQQRKPWQKKPTRIRVMWGKVIKTHGNSGVVRAKFKRNLPPAAMGKRIRVMLYPHRV
ncbi:hypothetical protein GJ496_000458 [Pomphorhynchus laevis]|nr:hypothetical protein GJ496_000458 [Pomphorhynchus laevis]